MSIVDMRKVEEIQRMVVKLIATSPAGEKLCLIGGFRYRFLDGSGRSSVDIDYHLDGDLDIKQREIIALLDRKFLPEVKSRFGYDGNVQAATGPEADSPFVRIVLIALYRVEVSGSRVEIPVEITAVPCADPPVVRTAEGTVYLTLSDADMVESKIIALFSRMVVQERDMVDIFLFRSSLVPDYRERLEEKFGQVHLDTDRVKGRRDKILSSRRYHARAIDRILLEQVDESAAASIAAAGGGGLVFDEVMELVP
jgi:hypothetical protein